MTTGFFIAKERGLLEEYWSDTGRWSRFITVAKIFRSKEAADKECKRHSGARVEDASHSIWL